MLGAHWKVREGITTMVELNLQILLLYVGIACLFAMKSTDRKGLQRKFIVGCWPGFVLLLIVRSVLRKPKAMFLKQLARGRS